jgi:hypothetical protein
MSCRRLCVTGSFGANGVGIPLWTLLTALFAAPQPVSARLPSQAPALPLPSGLVVKVSTEAQLQSAVRSLASNSTIVLAPGTYRLSNTVLINGSFSNVGIRGATSAPDDVVLIGKGMSNASYGNVPHGIWVGGNVRGVTIANLTVRDVYYHPIIFNAGTQAPHVFNVRLIDAGQQFIKANPDGTGGGVDNGIVEYSVFEYTKTAKDDYTNGVDVHAGRNWIVRHNLFRSIRAPAGQLAGPAVLIWNGSSGTTVEGNTFLNCQREIALGLIERTPYDHSGGVVRNNFIYRDASVAGDAAIGVFDSPDTIVAHNSILVSGGYPSPIEYRFAGSVGVAVVNNLLDGAILARDGASGSTSGNFTTARPALFRDPPSGDLHLRPTAVAVIGKGSTFVIADDWDGEGRVTGAASDIGADESELP